MEWRVRLIFLPKNTPFHTSITVLAVSSLTHNNPFPSFSGWFHVWESQHKFCFGKHLMTCVWLLLSHNEPHNNHNTHHVCTFLLFTSCAFHSHPPHHTNGVHVIVSPMVTIHRVPHDCWKRDEKGCESECDGVTFNNCRVSTPNIHTCLVAEGLSHARKEVCWWKGEWGWWCWHVVALLVILQKPFTNINELLALMPLHTTSLTCIAGASQYCVQLKKRVMDETGANATAFLYKRISHTNHAHQIIGAFKWFRRE